MKRHSYEYCSGNGTFIKEKCKIILLIIIKLQNYVGKERRGPKLQHGA
jgi:hypothetical protein